MSTTVTTDFTRSLPVVDRYDVIVCGGGPSGIPAAIAAARAGLKVLLVEQTGQLGGVGTSAGVSHLLGGRLPDNSGWCVAGIFKEIVEDLAQRGGALDPRDIVPEKFSPHGWTGKISSLTYGVPFDPVKMVAYLDEVMLREGVDVLYFTGFVDVETEANRVRRVILFNKSGLQAYETAAVVDATGDGDVAARSGCRFVKGRTEDGLMTPATLMFHVDHVDQDALSGEIYRRNSPRFRELIVELREQGIWNFNYDIFITIQLNEKGTLMVNTTRICDVDGTDGRSLSRGIMRGRQEVTELFAIMQAHFPGFANARIKMVAPMLGVRETRRIVSDYVMTVQDIVDGRDFEDNIGFSGYPWDLPDPKRPSHQPMHGHKMRMPRPFTAIPFRVLVPQPVENVICPGRAIGVERDVLGPLREMAPCYAMGHASGQAAAQVARDGVAFKDVDMPRLREELRQAGAAVDQPLHDPGRVPEEATV